MNWLPVYASSALVATSDHRGHRQLLMELTFTGQQIGTISAWGCSGLVCKQSSGQRLKNSESSMWYQFWNFLTEKKLAPQQSYVSVTLCTLLGKIWEGNHLTLLVTCLENAWAVHQGLLLAVHSQCPSTVSGLASSISRYYFCFFPLEPKTI